MRLIASLAVAAVVVLIAPAPAGDARERARCAVERSHTIARNWLVRVYSVRRGEGRRLVVCRRETGRRQLLAEAFDDGYVESGGYRDVRLAKRFVAFVYDRTDISCKADCPAGYDPSTTTLVIRDVLRRTTREWPATVRPRSLRLGSAGVAAWLAPSADGAELRVLDGAGERALDSGAIDPRSVTLSLYRLTWTSAGAPRSAVLAPP